MRLRPSMSATRPKMMAPKAAASKAVDVTRPTAQGDGCHSSFRIDMTTPMMKRSYASVKKPMPEMNMTFQCCFVILESSIRERMSVSFIVASDIGAFLLGDEQLRARHLPKSGLGCLVPMSQKFRKTAWYPAGNLRVPVTVGAT